MSDSSFTEPTSRRCGVQGMVCFNVAIESRWVPDTAYVESARSIPRGSSCLIGLFRRDARTMNLVMHLGI